MIRVELATLEKTLSCLVSTISYKSYIFTINYYKVHKFRVHIKNQDLITFHIEFN